MTITKSESAAGTSRRSAASAVIVAVAFLMVTLDALVVVTALPAIRTGLGGDQQSLQWIVNAYSLTFAAGIVTGAALGDRFGRRRIFLLGLAAFTLASCGCALAPTLGTLIAIRAIQGLAAALLAPVGLTLITSAFPPEKRGAAVGLWGGIGGLGVAAGPLIGGAVTDGWNWHWIFWINLPIGLVAIIGVARLIRESRGPARRLDVVGMILAALALAALVQGLVDGPVRGWGDLRTVLALLVAVAAVVGFVVRERVAPAPMIPLGMLGQPRFAASVVANTLASSAIFGATYLTSVYFQIARGYSPWEAGVRFLPWTITPLLVAPLAGRLTDRIGARRLAVPGLTLQALGFVWLVLVTDGTHSYAAFVVPMLIAGIGASLALPSLPAAALGSVDRQSLGVAAGVVNTGQRVGPVIGVALVTAVFSGYGSLASSAGTLDGYRPAMLAAAGLSLLGAFVAVGAGRR